jgi:D-glycerate 3-kinase
MRSAGRPFRRFSRTGAAAAQCDRLLVRFIEKLRSRLGAPALIGLSGPQGSGKSTAAARIAAILNERGCAAAVLSLDDFYLPRKTRLDLARDVHPLLLTRGVPGTHEIALLERCVAQMRDPAASTPVAVPVFDKLADDRVHRSDWRLVGRPLDVILVEGWCIGARPQAQSELAVPVNQLERVEDRDGRWRRFVNAQLQGAYGDLFARLDALVAFRAPSFEIVERWRGQQEIELAAVTRRSPALTGAELRRFVSHFERLTRSMDSNPTAGLVIDLDERRLPLGYARRGFVR